MMKTFKQFINEGNAIDFLKPKDLSDEQKLIVKAQEDIESIGLRTSNLQSSMGIHKFTILNIHNLDISITYRSEETEKYWNERILKENPKGWDIWIHDYRSDNNSKKIQLRLNNKSWEELLIDIINICFPDIEHTILNMEYKIEGQEISIEMNREFLSGVKNAKSIINENI